jgi:hypothetical protein
VLLAIRSPSLGRVSPRTLSTALSIVLALGLAHQLAGRYVILRYCGRINHVLAEYAAGRRTPEMTQYVYPDLRRADQVSAEMQRRGVYQ